MMLRVFLLFLALSLPACGFTPMHDPGFAAPSASGFKNIRTELTDDIALTDREGAYHMQQSLHDRLGANGAVYILRLTPKFRRSGYGLTSDDVASRYDMRASVKYQLLRAADGKVLDRGEVNTVSTFGAPGDPYGRIASEKNASVQVARDASDRIIIELGRYFKAQSSSAASAP